jgi:hypothetical protein
MKAAAPPANVADEVDLHEAAMAQDPPSPIPS